jgi:cobalamin 5'-phosphate synthase/cobalamin synthase
MIRRLLVACAFLSRVPIPGVGAADAGDLARATLFFPAVGAGIGLALAGAAHLFLLVLPPIVSAVLVVATGTLLTGALHLDGLADTADGLGGGRTREDALRIMRDHAVGAYGAIALVLLLVLRIAALSELLATRAFLAPLVAGAALSRWTTLPVAFVLPYARPEGGLGASVAGQVGRVEVVGGTILAAAVALCVAGWEGAAFGAAAVVTSALMAALCRRRLGGITGDTIGATIELAEVAILLLAVALR